jgi:hypothetical protein
MAFSRRSPSEAPALFDIDPEPAEDLITGFAGLTLVMEAYRGLQVGRSANRHLQIKERQRGFDEGTYLESFVLLQAAGGDCLDDFEHLRRDRALAQLIGHAMPSADAARRFLYAFHDESKIEQARQQLAPGASSYIPEESAPLRGLRSVNVDLIRELGARCPDQKIATIDLDGTIIESGKQQALPTYDGSTGYQPVLAVWAEMDGIVADQFRDGNVSAQQDPLSVAREAFAALPEQIRERWFRGDAGCYEQELLRWLRNAKRAGGPEGFIGFAVSARMSESLQERIRMLPEALWKPYREDAEATLECAEILNWDPLEKQAGEELDEVRYLAIRVRSRQGQLFGGRTMRHFAVVTNIWGKWSAKQVLEWHREKAGTIEAIHDVLKNELGAGVLPCGRFGANAAWLRMAAITHNVLTALKRLALPAELLRARPKRLRFLFLNAPGRLVQHARRLVLKLGLGAERIREWLQARPLLAPAAG